MATEETMGGGHLSRIAPFGRPGTTGIRLGWHLGLALTNYMRVQGTGRGVR